jgi:crossover junction endodeoxyribonuclease RuvC
MIILGIDPGYAIVGTGVVDYTSNQFTLLEARALTTQAGTPFERRLCEIYEGVAALIAAHKPAAMAVEKLYFNTNTATAIDVAQARGAILLAAALAGVPVYEYTPLQVKQSVVGYGRAEKRQVQDMTKLLLRLNACPKPDDVADALAIAICHAHSAGSLMRFTKG